MFLLVTISKQVCWASSFFSSFPHGTLGLTIGFEDAQKQPFVFVLQKKCSWKGCKSLLPFVNCMIFSMFFSCPFGLGRRNGRSMVDG